MVRASVLLCIVLGIVACSAQGWAPQQYITSFQFEGFDIIWANDTSFLDEVSYDWQTNSLYVGGEGWIQQVKEDPFEISYMGAFRWNHQFVDFKVFQDTKGNTYAVGPIPNMGGWGSSPTIGMNYPFSLVGTNTQHPMSEPPPGNYIMAAVQLNASIADVNVAYFVGWHQHWNATAGTNFTVIRSTVNTLNIPIYNYTNPQQNPIFKYNHDGNDRVYLHSEGFIAYDREFKPFVFHSPTREHLAIVDPATNAVYRVSTPLDINQPIAFNPPGDLLRISRWQQIVGATYDHVNHWVYIGLQGWGTMPGSIVVVNMFTMQMIVNYTLQNYESNPRSMSLDGNGNLYVALYGSMAMLKINVANTAAWSTQSYATIPFYLKNVYNIKVVNDYVYMVTNEQHSVVARIPTANFCPHVCDFLLGYCSNAECACFNTTLYEVGKDKRTCVEKAMSAEKDAHNQAKRNKGGEVALGLLFTVAFIAAVIGWFMVYRMKSNPYKHLQEHERLLH